jgi:hypothetical protein
MAGFVDPPQSDPASRVPEPAQHVDELQGLARLCEQGRVYEVEDWVRQGLPLHLAPSVKVHGRFRSPLQIALRTGQHSLALLLLRNGCAPDADRSSPFDTALQARRSDLVDLLFQFGADPGRVDLEILLDTYDSALYERFLSAGVDLTQDHALAAALAYHPGNKPLFGFAKHHRHACPAIQTELDIALNYHVRENGEKGIMLCLWAGADPHTPVRDLEYGSDDDPDSERETAVEGAAYRGNATALARFKPDPDRLDFDLLYQRAGNQSVVESLAKLRPPGDLTRIVSFHSSYAGSRWPVERDWRSALLAVLGCGVRWNQADPTELARIRRNLLRGEDWELRAILRVLHDQAVCAPEVFGDLTRTPAMQKHLLAAGLIKPHVKPPTKEQARRYQVGALAKRYDRQRLYEQVWQEPMTVVARTYGVSGVYLARVCRLLSVPVPPRGYWARVRNGQRVRRPALSKLRR